MNTVQPIVKKFIWDENRPPIHYRPGTSDEAIIQTVLVNQEEYKFLKQDMIDAKVIFDIGGNIGVVAVVLSTLYPKARIFSFEPIKENYELALKNVADYKNVEVLNYGLGAETGRKTIFHSDDPKNFGGFSTVIKSGAHETIDIREVAETVRELGVPQVIKIDVEGSEAEIFESFPNLDEVKWIAGELHGIREFQVLDLLSKHFEIQCARDFQQKCWHFHAANKALFKAPQQN